MIKFLFNALLTIVLLLSILIIIVGAAYVLQVELLELLEVDVFMNIKRKVRKYCYATEEEREKIRKSIFKRQKDSKRNRRSTFKRKKFLHEKGKGNRARLLIRRFNLHAISKGSNQNEQSIQQSDKKSDKKTKRIRG